MVEPKHVLNVLPHQAFDVQSLSFQLNLVVDELGCQLRAKPDQAGACAFHSPPAPLNPKPLHPKPRAPKL